MRQFCCTSREWSTSQKEVKGTRQSRTPKDVERAATTWLIYSQVAVEKILPIVSAQGWRLKAVLKDGREEGQLTHWLFCFTHKLNWAKETSALLSFSFSSDPLKSDSVKARDLNRHVGNPENWTCASSYTFFCSLGKESFPQTKTCF